MIKSLLKNAKDSARLFFLSQKRSISAGHRQYLVKGAYANSLVKFVGKSHQYEPELNLLIKTILHLRPGAFIDVGANVGQTFLKLLEIDEKRHYIGFEPQLNGCLAIDDFIQNNGLTGSAILPFGLSNKTEIVRLGINMADDASASIVKEYRPTGFHAMQRTILVIRGDDAIDLLELDEIALIKIDVEGAELEVIQGLKKTLAERKPYLLFEILPHFLLTTGQELDRATKEIRDHRHHEIDTTLRDLGYVIYQIQQNHGVKESSKLEAAQRQKFDYVAVPTDEATGFIAEYRMSSNI